jgi:DNA repair exonuclease SbcCD ATPase subunit
MSITLSPVLIALGSIAAFLLGIAMAIWTRRPIIQRLEGQNLALQAQLDGVRHELSATQQEKQVLEQELVDVRRELQSGMSRNEQLRDLVKIHVARRREFDEWAGPIKASLGEAVGQALRTLKDQLIRQESVLQRQEKLVAETQDQYRAKKDEIERMRRELSIKNYHIAALNERFIRIEERISDLSVQTSDAYKTPSRVDAVLGQSVSLAGAPQPTAPQLPLNMIEKPAEDWTQLLDEWHKRLDRRFGQLDALQANLQDRLGDASGMLPRYPATAVGSEPSTIQ